MKLKTIRMNADRHARLKVASQVAGCRTIGQYLEKLLDQPIAPQGGTEGEIELEVERRLVEQRKARLTLPLPRIEGAAPPHTLEECARVMLNMLPEATRDFAYEICESVLHILPSQLIHGHLMNAADVGRLQAPHIDPAWDVLKSQEPSSHSTCEWKDCHLSFTPERHGQRYCSNICGGKAASEMLPPPHAKTRPIITDERIASQGLVST